MNLSIRQNSIRMTGTMVAAIGLLSVAACGGSRHSQDGEYARADESATHQEAGRAGPTDDGDRSPEQSSEATPRDIDLAEAQGRDSIVGKDEPPKGETNMPNPDLEPTPKTTDDHSTTKSPSPPEDPKPHPSIVKRTVPGTAVSWEMVFVPGGRVQVTDENGEEKWVEVEGVWVGKTELPWEMYDIFVFNLDEGASNPEADAVSRPSRPYIPPDRGFGHGGYPAISMTTQGAVKFCEWLSAKTGRKYRVPTVAQWRLAALAGSKGPYSFGPDAEDIDEYAWTINTSPEKTQPLAQLKPNNYGLFDVEGNVMEWCRDGENFVACGGSYVNEPEDASCFSIAEQDWEWNMTDPQIPKSPWWLSDASWVGLRIICDDETVGEGDSDD
jgi:formylglycine-generating enzyme required for sulfatase activity